jgi:hypothetical protein
LGANCPTIYTAAGWIDRHEASAMLQALMTGLGYGPARFVWTKTGMLLHPVSFGLR